MPNKTAMLLRELAEACESGEFTEVVVFTGAGGCITGAASATNQQSALSSAAGAILEAFQAEPYHLPTDNRLVVV